MSKVRFLFSMACALFCGVQSAPALDLPPLIKDYLQTQQVLEAKGSPLPLCNADQTGGGDLFVQYTTANWSAMLDNLSTIAPEPRQQRLIIRAIEYLPGRDYLTALEKLCVSKANGFVSNETMEFALDARFPKQGYLADNYQDRQVIRLVKRLQSLLPNESNVQRLLADILNGRAKAGDEDEEGGTTDDNLY
jgi:hypothetical protein